MSTQNTTLVTLHLANGEQEAFSLPISSDTFFQQLQMAQEAPYLVFQLFDQTVCIQTNRIVKIDLEPPCQAVKGTFLFGGAERFTAMSRSSWRSS
jgi:hypothetical protein